MPADDRITFTRCVVEALLDEEMVESFDQLRGTNLALRGSPLERLIDLEAGRFEAELGLFVAFVRDCVWDRLPPEARACREPGT